MDVLTLPLPSLLAIASAVMVGAALLALFTRRPGSPSDPQQQGRQSSNLQAGNGTVEDSSSFKERCTILFGTQTGTAERFAKSLRAQLESKYGSHTAFDVLDIENYDTPSRLPNEKLVILLLATYGDGEPTDSASEFYTWLTAAAAEDQPELLNGVTFGVFGLGNRQYEHFCAMGKKVHKLMGELGGTAVVRRGDGDDDRDIDQDFDSWTADLFAGLDKSELVQQNKGGAINLTANTVPAYEVVELHDAPVSAVDQLPSGGSGSSHHSIYIGRVLVVRELHRGGSRSCVHVEVDISGSSVQYKAGDHVGVMPENSPAVVEAAARALGLPLGMAFQLRLPKAGSAGLADPPAHGTLTLRAALARHADLLSAPNKSALQALAAFARDEAEAARLARLASIEGREEYHAYVVAAKRSLLEVLQDFPSAKPSLGAFFGSIAPHLQPRYYSISSSPRQHPSAIHITCAVVSEAMPSGRVHEGVASTWLARLRPGGAVPLFVRPSTFRLPADVATPVVMVGPGTGVAPFRGFLQERAALAGAGARLGPAHLFFGCRNRAHDFIYEQELEEAVATGALSQLHVAFSRDGPTKDYVQHHLATHGAEVWDLLSDSRGGILYVCGDASAMAQDVHRALQDIVSQVTRCSQDKAEAAVKRLLQSNRYLRDVW